MSNTENCPVRAYYDAWNNGDMKSMRSTMTDDFTFKGPMEQHESPESFIASCTKMLEQWGEMKINPCKLIVDGSDVVSLYAVKTPGGDVPMAEYFEIKDGKIGQIRLHFDSKAFAH